MLNWSKNWLKVDGSAYFILPESRRAGFELELLKSGLSLKRSRLVFPRETKPPNFFLAECGQAPGGCQVMAP